MTLADVVNQIMEEVKLDRQQAVEIVTDYFKADPLTLFLQSHQINYTQRMISIYHGT